MGTKHHASLKQLEAELNSFQEQFPRVSADNLFTAWFLRAYLTETDSEAIESITGAPGDKGVDAVLIDGRARVVYIIQSKYRPTRFNKPESRPAVMSFATIAEVVCDPDKGGFAEFTAGMDTPTAARLKEARQCIQKSEFRLVLMFVTLGAVSRAIERDAKRATKRALKPATFEILDGKRCVLLLHDYLDGAAPPIPTLDIPIEYGAGVKVQGVLQRYDTTNGLECWVFSAKGDAIAEMLDIGRRRLFARNIRGFLGERTAVNESMLKTLKDQPELFFYYNNGITIVCDRAEKVSHRGTDVLRVNNPQVINGQQTSRVLAEGSANRSASVLVKVIQVPRDVDRPDGEFDALVSKIVQATNYQNAIKPSDLMANDRRQLAIEKEFRRCDYFYARKRQTKGEIRSQMRGKRYLVITKEELAQSVAGCELDPVYARSGKDNLFVEDVYDLVFPTAKPEFYLPRYWLFREVTKGSRGAPRRGYTKWMVLGFLWRELAAVLRTDRAARAFSNACRMGDERLLRPLSGAVNAVFVQALAYYRANRGHGETQMDVSLFFRSKKGRDREFRRFWNELPRRRADKLAVRLKRVKRVLEVSGTS